MVACLGGVRRVPPMRTAVRGGPRGGPRVAGPPCPLGPTCRWTPLSPPVPWVPLSPRAVRRAAVWGHPVGLLRSQEPANPPKAPLSSAQDQEKDRVIGPPVIRAGRGRKHRGGLSPALRAAPHPLALAGVGARVGASVRHPGQSAAVDAHAATVTAA